MIIKAAITVMAGIVILFVLTLSWCRYMEKPKSYFSNYDQAKESGIMKAGWMPAFIPRTSTDIHEQHNIDTNEVFMSFKYSLNENINLSAHCSRKQQLENGMRYFCSDRFGSPTLDLYTDGTGKINPQNEKRF